KLAGQPCDVTGISPFTATSYPTRYGFTTYAEQVDYLQDTLANFAHFGLPEPKLLRAYSTDDTARQLVESRRWNAIYIDGNHDYEVAKADWQLCAANVADGGIIVLDDAGLTTSYEPPAFSSKGLPGPSQVADETDRSRFRE